MLLGADPKQDYKDSVAKVDRRWIADYITAPPGGLTMRRHDDRASERQMIAGFAAAGVILFAGTLLVGFSARDLDRKTPPPALVGPSVTASAVAAADPRRSSGFRRSFNLPTPLMLYLCAIVGALAVLWLWRGR